MSFKTGEPAGGRVDGWVMPPGRFTGPYEAFWLQWGWMGPPGPRERRHQRPSPGARDRSKKRATGLTAFTRAKRATDLTATEASGRRDVCSRSGHRENRPQAGLVDGGWSLDVSCGPFLSPLASVGVGGPAETASKGVRKTEKPARGRAGGWGMAPGHFACARALNLSQPFGFDCRDRE